MATGPLRFRTPHIEELPTTQSKQAPGFAWIAVPSAAADDPAKNWGTTNRKRQRTSLGGQTDQQREALSARQKREIERKINELNNDNSKDVQIELSKKHTTGATKVGKTANTKKILASGKWFAHYLDDEEAEIAKTGRRDGDVEPAASAQRASKTPIARRNLREDSSVSGSPAPVPAPTQPSPLSQNLQSAPFSAVTLLPATEDDDEDVNPSPPLPSEEEIEALLDHPPLTYNEARSAPPPSTAPPPRRFCETCGYWGRVKCMKCGTMTCSVACKDDHDQFRCLKMYA
ncbi:hypothetical protein BAUCODRAFT_358325 [Baudoinia panamericana UAMH 10762]|uniref:HIT-type domain-containing protein n=1 Tax=Baudoinia panamericana (strain UAMH 10762) TaxID=717646 RepID=M2MSY5_BAUPA|nr:uncharacterized protein BAUCODRAFT_358325 [Baudoinia panamericana UAMH 10762]EMC99981.1 hypothetical protein BAUCODRAFT_358325 [Baudoinia panamericana UAMH 10762]